MTTLLTIGHSNHSIERFLEMLKSFNVTAVADMRSVPYSSAQPQFNREALAAVLGRSGITYVFMGDELGLGAFDIHCYVDGKVDFTRVAESQIFLKGVRRIQDGLEKYRLAMMCSEGDPLQCHRSVLLARYFTALGIQVQHILPDGRLEAHDDTVDHMLHAFGLAEADMFRTPEQAVDDAYRLQGQRLPSNRRVTHEEP
jgi:uncharacterized protein (DUF488 family)